MSNINKQNPLSDSLNSQNQNNDTSFEIFNEQQETNSKKDLEDNNQ
jgi:hypothetical protein